VILHDVSKKGKMPFWGCDKVRTCRLADRPMGKLRSSKMRTPCNQTPNERGAVMCICLL